MSEHTDFRSSAFAECLCALKSNKRRTSVLLKLALNHILLSNIRVVDWQLCPICGFGMYGGDLPSDYRYLGYIRNQVDTMH